MLKRSDNPPMLNPPWDSVESLPGTWWVAHTRARCEKALAWDLLAAHVSYYLPLMPRVIFSGGRKRNVQLPMFASYVFICGGADARQRALMTGRICQVIPVPDQQQLVRELSQVERVLSGEVPFDPYPYAAIGGRCRVKAGPFTNCEGIVIERRKMATLVLQVSLLGQGISMDIDTDLLEPMDAPAMSTSGSI